jgi:hypothetical protein
MAGCGVTAAGTYTNMRRLLGLAPKFVTSCSDAAEARTGARRTAATTTGTTANSAVIPHRQAMTRPLH